MIRKVPNTTSKLLCQLCMVGGKDYGVQQLEDLYVNLFSGNIVTYVLAKVQA